MFFSHKRNEMKQGQVRAFSYLGEKIKFSVIGNAFTLYPNFTQGVTRKKVCSALSMIEADPEINGFGIYRSHFEHAYYHLDHIDEHETHFHRHFYNQVTTPILAKILACFVSHELITEQEKHSFLQDFQQVNLISNSEFEQILTQVCLAELRYLIQQTYSRPQDAILRKLAEDVVNDFAQIMHKAQDLIHLRHCINLVGEAIRKPVRDNIHAMQSIAEQFPATGSNLADLLIALGPCLSASSVYFSLGIAVPALGIGMLGLGIHMLYNQEHEFQEISNEMEGYRLMDNTLSRDLSSFSMSLR